ncbi:PREDICTED: glucose-6-phosphate exchanger SLC37A2 isoform X2 [Nicrophorus vespilloides]|uniref:Sugar phosphate exchanger 3 n=1 Tax=Nicrophorus vespilloides TaxID=110193 RepID=A0ABM1MS70_NICVS|nr:PREDICTED: glucose-6-phosphate exchanger SLC37A2 isoform X2 [Nicrophorus vespilloides]
MAEITKMTLVVRDIPLGVRFLRVLSKKCCPLLHFNREVCYRSSVLLLTYISYMCYHLSRKPISVVKPVLHHSSDHNSTMSDWAPFDGSDADAATLLGTLDSAFLFAYAFAMFASGFVAERVNLRYFLSLGMLFSGVASYLFGIARSYDIHSMTYFIVVQIFGGICQTTGWPGVVTVVGKWFGKGKRGLIFGIWNSHTSIGNILGSLIASKYVETDWSNCFIVPGLIMGFVGFILYLFLVVNPMDVGLQTPDAPENNKRNYRRLEDQVANVESPYEDNNSDVDDTEILIGDQEVQRRVNERSYLLRNQSNSEEEAAIGFVDACKIPGVIEFSLSLFFSKLVSYTFLYWLPLYLANSKNITAKDSAEMSTLFDVGGIVGAIAAGLISDYSGMSASTCVGMLMMAAPMMFIYQHFASISMNINMFLLILVGILVNGPYALITTAVSAELGTHSSLRGNSKALATVTAIIDGTGSIGAGVGPFLAGLVYSYGWNNVFYMLIASDIIALVLLLRLVKQEISKYKQHRRENRIGTVQGIFAKFYDN